MKLKVVRIGNSRGVRLPPASLRRYRIGDSVMMEARAEGLLLRPVGPAVTTLSWADTAREMAASGEDWSDWDGAIADGLEHLPWKTGKQATPGARQTKPAALSEGRKGR